MMRLPLLKRLRRNRKSASVRAIVRETNIVSSDLIWPIFLKDGSGIREEIEGMPGVYRWSLDVLAKELERLCLIGLKAVILFPVIDAKRKINLDLMRLTHTTLFVKGFRKSKNLFPICVLSAI